jgi:hypothetical protein
MALEPIKDITKLNESQKSPVTVDTDLSLKPADVLDPVGVPGMDVAEMAAKATQGLGEVEKSLAKLREVNVSRLQGRLSPDVVSQIRIGSAEGAQARGIGADSPAARALSAQDLGLTSLQLQESGVQTEMGINSLQSSLAQIADSRAKFSAEFRENERRFNETLALDQTKLGLASRELMFKRDAFNAEQNARIVGFLSELSANRASAAAQIALSGKSAGGVLEGLDNVLTQLDTMLNRISGK